MEHFQSGRYDQAQLEFESMLKDPAYRFSALYNLGNTAYKIKRPGLALAYYRLARNLSPRDSDLAFNYQLVIQEFKISPPSGTIGTWEIFRQDILGFFTFFELSAISFGFFAPFTFFLSRYLIQNRALPPQTYIWGVLFVFSFILSMGKMVDTFIDRATVVAQKAEVKSGPSSSLATLVELPVGTEVLLHSKAQDETGAIWKQVSIPGSITGWVSDKVIMQTSGDGPW